MKTSLVGAVACLCLLVTPVMLAAQAAMDAGVPPVTDQVSGAPVPESADPAGQDSASGADDGDGGGSIGASQEDDDLFTKTVALDIATADRSALLAWVRQAGLDESGGVQELRQRLYSYYGVKAPPAADKTGRTITIRSADRTEYISATEGSESVIRFAGRVSLTVKDDEKGETLSIDADEITVNQDAGILSARGDILFERKKPDGTDVFMGELLDLDMDDWSGVFLDGQSSRDGQSGIAKPESGQSATGSQSSSDTAARQSPLFFRADDIVKRGTDVLLFRDGVVSSCDDENPHYSIRASRIWILGGNEWAMLNATLSVGEVPLLYLPFFYYPGEEIVFHPVFGTDPRFGRYVQTTTYLLGEKPPKEQEISLLRIADGEGGYERKVEGVFLRTTRKKKEGSTADFIKVMADLYSTLGGFAGVQGQVGAVGPFSSLKWFAGAGVSRSLFLQSDGVSYTPFSAVSDYASIWNSIDLFGTDIPFRFALDLSATLKAGPLNLTITAPVYSDPWFNRDFRDRSEDMNWLQFLDQDKEETDPAKVSTFSDSLSASVNVPVDALKPWVTQLSVSKIASSLGWTAIALDAPSDATSLALHNASPAREFFSPGEWTIVDAAASLGGTLFSWPRVTTASRRSMAGAVPGSAVGTAAGAGAIAEAGTAAGAEAIAEAGTAAGAGAIAEAGTAAGAGAIAEAGASAGPAGGPEKLPADGLAGREPEESGDEAMVDAGTPATAVKPDLGAVLRRVPALLPPWTEGSAAPATPADATASVAVPGSATPADATASGAAAPGVATAATLPTSGAAAGAATAPGVAAATTLAASGAAAGAASASATTIAVTGRESIAGFVLPPLVTPETPVDREPFAASLSWTMTPTASIKRKFQSGAWDAPEDIDWSALYETRTVRDAATVSLSAKAYDRLLTVDFGISGSTQYQDRPLVSYDATQASQTLIETWARQDAQYRNDKLSGTFRLTSAPLQDNWFWSSSSLTYSLSSLLYERAFEAMAPDNPDDASLAAYTVRQADWTDETVSAHTVSAVFGVKPYGQDQSLTLTANLPPELTGYSGALSLKAPVGSLSISSSYERPGQDEPLAWKPLSASLSLGKTPWPVLGSTMSWDVVRAVPVTMTGTAAWNGLSASVSAREAETYRLVIGDGWQSDGVEVFRPAEASLAYRQKLSPGPFWQDRISMSLDIDASARQSFVRFTDSSLSLTMGLSFRVHEFLDLSFASSSRNSSLWRYFPSAFVLPEGIGVDDVLRNPIEDILMSFNFFDAEGTDRRDSLFKLKSLSVTATHHMHDWDLSFKLSSKPVLDDDSLEYNFVSSWSVTLAWNAVSQIKTTYSREGDVSTWD